MRTPLPLAFGALLAAVTLSACAAPTEPDAATTPSAKPSASQPSAPVAVPAGAPDAVPGGAPVVDRLPEILTDAPARTRSSARHVTVGTPYGEEYRLLAAEMLDEVELSDLQARTDPELDTAMGRLVRYERQVSRRRQRLQRTLDDCSAEITRRYRQGEAQVDELVEHLVDDLVDDLAEDLPV